AEEIGRHTEQVESVLQDGEEKHPEHNSAHRAAAADQAGATQDRYGQHVQLLSRHGRRYCLVDAIGLDEAADRSEQPEIAVGNELNAEDIDAYAARGLRVAAKGV